MCIRDSPIETNQPISSDGQTTYSGTLPSGLALDAATGAITGTPDGLNDTPFGVPTQYTITASHPSAINATITLTITVNDTAPAVLYDHVVHEYTVDVEMPVFGPPTSGGGAAVSYSITPALPAGLTLAHDTGILSGTPTVVTPLTMYSITVSNTGGSAVAEHATGSGNPTSNVLALQVKDVPPSWTTPYAGPFHFTSGVAVHEEVTLGGGTVVAFTVDPPLPAGLDVDQTTGHIVGIPTTFVAATDYTITATNSGGAVPTMVSIAVDRFLYPDPVITGVYGQMVPAQAPSLSYGLVPGSFALQTALAGITLDVTTGHIAFHPDAFHDDTPVVVTALSGTIAVEAHLTLRVMHFRYTMGDNGTTVTYTPDLPQDQVDLLTFTGSVPPTVPDPVSGVIGPVALGTPVVGQVVATLIALSLIHI